MSIHKETTCSGPEKLAKYINCCIKQDYKVKKDQSEQQNYKVKKTIMSK